MGGFVKVDCVRVVGGNDDLCWRVDVVGSVGFGGPLLGGCTELPTEDDVEVEVWTQLKIKFSSNLFYEIIVQRICICSRGIWECIATVCGVRPRT